MPPGFLESQMPHTEKHYSVTGADYIQILVLLLPAESPQASYIASLCLSFLICEMKIIIAPTS